MYNNHVKFVILSFRGKNFNHTVVSLRVVSVLWVSPHLGNTTVGETWFQSHRCAWKYGQLHLTNIHLLHFGSFHIMANTRVGETPSAVKQSGSKTNATWKYGSTGGFRCGQHWQPPRVAFCPRRHRASIKKNIMWHLHDRQSIIPYGSINLVGVVTLILFCDVGRLLLRNMRLGGLTSGCPIGSPR